MRGRFEEREGGVRSGMRGGVDEGWVGNERRIDRDMGGSERRVWRGGADLKMRWDERRIRKWERRVWRGDQERTCRVQESKLHFLLYTLMNSAGLCVAQNLARTRHALERCS
eukprot:3833644-Rhodomonas_salina.1